VDGLKRAVHECHSGRGHHNNAAADNGNGRRAADDLRRQHDSESWRQQSNNRDRNVVDPDRRSNGYVQPEREHARSYVHAHEWTGCDSRKMDDLKRAVYGFIR
jgi:hypothetical protein